MTSNETSANTKQFKISVSDGMLSINNTDIFNMENLNQRTISKVSTKKGNSPTDYVLKKNNSIAIAFEGVMCCAIRLNGKTRLYGRSGPAKKSRWNSKKTMLEAFVESGGNLDDLYPSSIQNSSQIFLFTIVHDIYQTVSLHKKSNFVLIRCLSKPDRLVRFLKSKNLDFSDNISDIEIKDYDLYPETPGYYVSSPLDIQKINNVLANRVKSDMVELSPGNIITGQFPIGESLVVLDKNSISYEHLISPDYKIRLDIWGKCQNTNILFFKILNMIDNYLSVFKIQPGKYNFDAQLKITNMIINNILAPSQRKNFIEMFNQMLAHAIFAAMDYYEKGDRYKQETYPKYQKFFTLLKSNKDAYEATDMRDQFLRNMFYSRAEKLEYFAQHSRIHLAAEYYDFLQKFDAKASE